MGYYGQPSIFASIAKGVFIAVLAYGAFPTIFAICKPKINVKSYRWICFLVNFAAYLCFALIGGNYNAAPYLLWTLAFCFIFKRFLPEIEPPIDYSKMEKKSFEEVSSSVPEEVLEQCGSQRGSREGITRVAESFAKDGIIPLEYVPVLVDEYMKPVNTVDKKEFVETFASIDVKRKMFCRNCGKQIPTDSKFCGYCGTEVNNQVETDEGNNKVNYKKESFWGEMLRYKNGMMLYISIAVAGITFVLLLYAFTTHPVAASLPPPVPTQSQTPEPTLTRQAMPENGKMFVTPDYESVCPFSFSGEYGTSYYVYLEYQYAPNNSYYSRHENTGNPTEENIAFFVRPGYSVEIDVPVGIYKLYYAFGNGWFGPKDLFGKDTTYCTVSDLLEFYTDYTTAYGININLRAQYDGNFETENINASQFPGQGWGT